MGLFPRHRIALCGSPNYILPRRWCTIRRCFLLLSALVGIINFLSAVWWLPAGLWCNEPQRTGQFLPSKQRDCAPVVESSSQQYKTPPHLSRPFPLWRYGFDWCVPTAVAKVIGNKKRNKFQDRGLFYVKLTKAASSTSGGIAHRIAVNVGKRQLGLQRKGQFARQNRLRLGPNECSVRMTHGRASDPERDYGGRDKTKSFLWSIVRQPTSRAMSQIFHFEVSRGGMEPTDENITKYLKVEGMGSNQFEHLATQPIDKTQLSNVTYIENMVREIIREYDFIGISDRYDESLVVLRLLLGLEVGDVLHLNAKRSGMYDDGQSPKGCVKVQKSFISPNVKSYLSSGEWVNASLPDRILYDAVNASLDMTIENLGGRLWFEKALDEHRKHMQLVQERCAVSAIYPCSSEGTKQRVRSAQNCYWNDGGCGYPCIDSIVTEFGINKGEEHHMSISKKR